MIQLLKVVNEPQNPTPTNNLKGLLRLEPKSKPIINDPVKLTRRLLFICQRINAAGIAPAITNMKS